MFNNSNIEYQFMCGIMAFAEDLANSSYAFSSHSMSAPLFGSKYAMENRQFGAMMPNNRDRMEMRRQQQQHKPHKGRRQATRVGWVSCRHCPNQMPPQNMAGHLERKHNILPGSSDDHERSAKRKRSAVENDAKSDDVGHDYYPTVYQHVQKRARPNANSTNIEERAPIDAIIPRPMTPPSPSPPPIANLANASRNSSINKQPSTPQVICLRNEAYNVVHISDRELNKFMRSGRVGIRNGRLILNDSIDDE